MYSFENDYSEGAHAKILEKLIQTNFEQLSGYGTDKYCDSAKEKIRRACECDNADIFFISGGTQTNKIVISALLGGFEGVVSASTGHVNGHEAGAIESTGHKVMPLPGKDGKLDAETLKNFVKDFYADANHEHMVFPGMVYISHPTEYGTLYTKSELTALSDICREYSMPLFLDGARLGYGIAAPNTDLTLPDIARLCDVFYIGGTKVGALCGEAVVFTHGNAPKHFMTLVKQHGALLAKGRLMGVQFDALFEDGLYFEISKNAIEKAERLRKILSDNGYEFFIQTVTNQIFVVLENEEMESLKKQVKFGFWEKYDETHTVVRFATSWATTDEAIDALESILRK